MQPKFKKYEVVYCEKAGYEDSGPIKLGVVMEVPSTPHEMYLIALLTPLYLEYGDCYSQLYHAFESELEHLPPEYRSGALYPECATTFAYKHIGDDKRRDFRKYEVVNCSWCGYIDSGNVKLGVVMQTPEETHHDGLCMIQLLTPLYLNSATGRARLWPAKVENLRHLPAPYASPRVTPEAYEQPITTTTKIEEDKTMTFNEVTLKNGDIVFAKNDNAYLFLSGGNYGNGWLHSLKTDNCLYKEENGNWYHYLTDSVVDDDFFRTVLRPDYAYSGLKEALDVVKGERNDNVYHHVVWMYTPPKEMTVAEIEKILGYSIKVVKEG